MSQKNETTVLVLALLITLGVVGSGFWLFKDKIISQNQLNSNSLPTNNQESIKDRISFGEKALGMVVAVPWHIDGNLSSNFPQKSRQLWNADVSWRTALSYDATQAFISALEVNSSREGVQQALTSSNFTATGASGAIRFLASGDRNAPVQLVKIAPGTRSGTGYDFVPISQSPIKK